LDLSCLNDFQKFDAWNNVVNTFSDAFSLSELKYTFSKTLFGNWGPRSEYSHMQLLAGANCQDFQENCENASISVFAVINDALDFRTHKFEAEWNGFWHFYNVMQFLPGFVAASQSGLNDGVYHSLPTLPLVAPPPILEVEETAASWLAVLEDLLDEKAQAAAKRFIDAGLPAPSTVGYELLDSAEAVIAEAEMAWEGARIVWLLPEQEVYQAIITAADWLVITGESAIDPTQFERRLSSWVTL
jgi:DEAD/DEAH box helicase domain-containing protein